MLCACVRMRLFDVQCKSRPGQDRARKLPRSGRLSPGSLRSWYVHTCFWVEVLTEPPDMPGVVIALFSDDEQLLGGSCEQF